MKKRVVAMMLVGILLLSLVACGKSDKEGVSVQNSQKQSSESASKEITFTCMQSGTYDAAAKDVADQLKKKGINVTVEAYPYANLRQKNTTDIVTGTNAYDVASGGYYLVDLYPNYLPLQSYFDKSEYTKTLIDGVTDKCERYEGEIVGFPYGMDCYGFIYRKDLFEEYGIEIPQTWEDFNKALEVLKEKLPEGVETFAFAEGATEQLIGPFLATYGGSYINGEKFELEKEAAVEAVKNIQNRFETYGTEDMTAMTIDQANALFLQGKVAVIEGWPSFITGMANDPEQSEVVDKWGVIPYPQDKGGCSWLSMWALFVNKNSQNSDEALDFAASYSGVDNAADQFVKYGIGSCHKDTYTDDKVVEKYGKDFLDGQLVNLAWAKNPPLSGEANDYLCQTFGDVFAKKITAEEGVDKINQQWATLEVPISTLEQAKLDGFVK